MKAGSVAVPAKCALGEDTTPPYVQGHHKGGGTTPLGVRSSRGAA